MDKLPSTPDWEPANSVTGRLRQYRPRKIWFRRWTRRAAVSAILRPAPESRQPEILLIRRTERDGDPWSGHMSFPGGRMDPEDGTIYRTALRELWEETGLEIERLGDCIGRLSDVAARPWRPLRRPLVVSPFIFSLTGAPDWRLDPLEVAEIVWVPLPFFADRANRQTMTWSRGGVSIPLPCYWYNGFRIWGLTLRMLDELVAAAYPADGLTGQGFIHRGKSEN